MATDFLGIVSEVNLRLWVRVLLRQVNNILKIKS